MKILNHIRKLAVLGLCAGALWALPAHATDYYYPTNAPSGIVPLSLTSAGIAENFVLPDWTGTSGCPLLDGTGWYVSNAYTTNEEWRGFGQGYATSGTGYGFWAFSETSGSDDNSFGMMEQSSPNDWDNARLYMAFVNNTGAPVNRLRLNYILEQWHVGQRWNSIELGYNATSGSNGSFGTFLQTPAPQLWANNGNMETQLVGTGTANQVGVSYVVSIPTLAVGGTGWWTWRFATYDSSTGTRDALAVANVNLVALPSGTNNVWTNDAGTGDWNLTDANWTLGSGVWSNTANYNADFDGGGGTIALTSSITAVDLDFVSNGYTINSSGGSTLTLNGIIDTGSNVTGTVNAVISGSLGLTTEDVGTLILGGSNTYTGNTSISAGTLEAGAANVIPASSLVDVNASATFNLNNQDVTVEGLTDSGVVQLGAGTSGTLVIDNTSLSSTYKFSGSITGTNGLVLVDFSGTGAGIQEFASNEQPYASPTEVYNGELQVTQSGTMPNTASITIVGGTTDSIHDDPASGQPNGVFDLQTNGTNSVSYSFPAAGAIQMYGGYLIGENDGSTTGITQTLANGVVMEGPGTTGTSSTSGWVYDNRIYSSGSSTQFHISGAISGSGDWRLNGHGTLYLDAANTFAGELNLNDGIIYATNANSIENGHLYFGDASQIGRQYIVAASGTIGGGIEADVTGTLAGFHPYQYALLSIGTNSLTESQTAYVSGTGGGADEIKPSFQGDIQGSGTFVKIGDGTSQMDRYNKTFTGQVLVNQGVLEMSSTGLFIQAAGYTVNPGGQIRLSTGGTSSYVNYNFGGTLVVSSTARYTGTDSIVQPQEDWGQLGGLRFDPDASEGQYYASISSNVAISGTGDIHVNGLGSILELTGTLSGSGELNQTGGGTVDYSGAHTSSYSGLFEPGNGTTVVGNGQVFDGAVYVTMSSTESPVLDCVGSATFEGNVGVPVGGFYIDYGSTLQYHAGATNTINVPNGSAYIDPGSTIDLQETGTAGHTYPMISAPVVSGSGNEPTFINNPMGTNPTLIYSGTGIELSM